MKRKTYKFKRRWTGPGSLAVLLVATGWLASGLREVRADDASAKEYQVKAACLLNFAQFIEWPTAAMPKAGEAIMLGVLGDDPFGSVLEQTFQDELIQGRKVAVKRSRQIDDLKACHMLFVSKSEKEKATEILASLNDTSIVTVSEMDQFAHQGGIVNFYIEANKVRFEINADAAQRKGLKINSQLLKRAKLVGSDSGRGKN